MGEEEDDPPFFSASLSWYHRQRRVNPFRAIGRAARATNDNGGRQQWWKKENTRSKGREKTRKNRSQKGRERGEAGGMRMRKENPWQRKIVVGSFV